MVSKKAAKRLLDMTDKFYLPIDHFMFGNLFPYFKKFICYQVIPAVCIQDIEFRGKDSIFKSMISSGKEEKFFRRVRKKMGLGAKIKRELIRFSLQVESRLGFRKKIINTFNSDESILMNLKGSDRKNDIPEKKVSENNLAKRIEKIKDEYGLFLFWGTIRSLWKGFTEEVSNKFELLDVIEIEWSE